MLAFLPLRVLSDYVSKCREILAAVIQAHSQGDTAHVSNLVGLFLALPSIALTPPRRSRLERTLKRNLSAVTVDPTVNVLAEWTMPLLDAPSFAPAREPDADDPCEAAQRANRCLDVLRARGLAAARRALVDPPLPPVTQEALDTLHRLHPGPYHARPVPEMPTAPPPVRVNPDKLVELLDRVSATASPGMSGWRKAFVQPLLSDGTCVNGLALVVELVLNGSLTDPVVRHALLGSRLIALSKMTGAGGVRPIAIGDIFIKLAAHYALEAVAAYLPKLFHPVQLGLYTPRVSSR